MEFNNRPIDQRTSNQVPGYNYLAEQARRAGYMGSYGGQFHPQYLQGHSQPRPQPPHLHPHLHPHPHTHPHPHPPHLHLQPPHLHPLLHPHDLHEAINREIEKQRIREEIILSEIAMRRVLEAEVRRELTMERELAHRRGDDGFPFVPPLGTGCGSTIRTPLLGISDGRSLDERVTVPHKEKEKQNVRHESGELQTLPFQRCISVPRISEVTPVPEAMKEEVKEKEKIVLLAKPQEYKRGEKRKAATSSVADDAELLSATVSRKKAKEEWSCALCQVIATSEQALKDHVRGKKHKAKEAALRAQRAGKDYSIGFFPKKAAAPVGTKTVGSNEGVKSASKSLQLSKTKEMNSKNKHSGGKGMQNAGNSKKNKYKFWCEMCQVGAFCQKVMNAHKEGKKHVRRLQEFGRNGDTSSTVKEEAVVGVDDAGDRKNTTVENVGEGMATVSSNDHRTVNVEDHKAMEATKPEGNGAMSAAKPEKNDNDLAEPEDTGAVNTAKPDDKAIDDHQTDDVIIPGISDAIVAPKSDDDKAADAPELNKAMDDKEVDDKVES